MHSVMYPAIFRSVEDLQKKRRVVVILGAAILMLSCGGHNIEPGEGEYPALNPAPQKVIDVAIDVPADIQVHLNVQYYVTKTAKTCEWDVSFETAQPFSITSALQLKRKGTHWAGSFLVDRYLPGSCGWSFGGSSFNVEGSPEGLPAYSPLFVFDGSEHPSNIKINAWCLRPPTLKGLVCNDIEVLQLSFKEAVPSSVAQEIVAKNMGGDLPAHIGPKTSSIEVEFRDLDKFIAERAGTR